MSNHVIRALKATAGTAEFVAYRTAVRLKSYDRIEMI
jgi:hypothetical protein